MGAVSKKVLIFVNAISCLVSVLVLGFAAYALGSTDDIAIGK